MEAMGALLIVVGVVLVINGIVLIVVGRLGGGTLPGDIHIQKGNLTVFAPCLTMLIVSVLGSILLTVILNLIMRALNR